MKIVHTARRKDKLPSEIASPDIGCHFQITYQDKEIAFQCKLQMALFFSHDHTETLD